MKLPCFLQLPPVCREVEGELNWQSLINMSQRAFHNVVIGTLRINRVFFPTLASLASLAHHTPSSTITRFCRLYGFAFIRGWWNVTIEISNCQGCGITITVAFASSITLPILGQKERRLHPIEHDLAPPLRT